MKYNNIIEGKPSVSAKLCTKCNKIKPIKEFNKSGRDGYQPYCKECKHEYYMKYKKEFNEKIEKKYGPKEENKPIEIKRKVIEMPMTHEKVSVMSTEEYLSKLCNATEMTNRLLTELLSKPQSQEPYTWTKFVFEKVGIPTV